jgi:membrane protein DedA with SNARE-associated domain
VLIGRVIPVIRSFLSVPAGLAEMNRVRFAVLTTIGSAVWVALITGLGYAAGKNWNHVSKDFHAAQWPIVVVVVLAIAWAIWHRIRTIQRQQQN